MLLLWRRERLSTSPGNENVNCYYCYVPSKLSYTVVYLNQVNINDILLNAHYTAYQVIQGLQRRIMTDLTLGPGFDDH